MEYGTDNCYGCAGTSPARSSRCAYCGRHFAESKNKVIPIRFNHGGIPSKLPVSQQSKSMSVMGAIMGGVAGLGGMVVLQHALKR